MKHSINKNGDVDDTFLFLGLLMTAIAVMIAGNLPIMEIEVIKRTLKIGTVACGLVSFIYVIKRATESVVKALLIAYTLLVLVTVYKSSYISFAAIVILLISFILFMKDIKRVKKWGCLVLMAILGGLVILSTPNIITTFNNIESLARGHAHIDTLFHASMASMIKNYGINSTGIDGLVVVPYHVFSHYLYAGISILSGVGVYEVYGSATWIIFSPILIFSIAYNGNELYKYTTKDNANEIDIVKIWILTCGALIFIPMALERWGIFYGHFLSESYLVSLGIIILAMSDILKIKYKINDILLILLIIGILTLTKVTTGLIFILVVSVKYIIVIKTPRLYKRVLICGAMWGLFSYILFLNSDNSGGSVKINPFHYIENYSLLGNEINKWKEGLNNQISIENIAIIKIIISVISFMVMHFIVSWVGLAVNKNNGKNSKELNEINFYILISAVSGLMIVSILEVPSGSAGFFSGVALFIALPSIIIYVKKLIGINKKIIVIVLLLVSGSEIYLYGKRYFKSLYTYKLEYPVMTNKLVNDLIKIRSEKKELVYRLKDGEEVVNPFVNCEGKPFVYSAISERAWKDVIKKNENCKYINYGYARYEIREISVNNRELEEKIYPD